MRINKLFIAGSLAVLASGYFAAPYVKEKILERDYNACFAQQGLPSMQMIKNPNGGKPTFVEVEKGAHYTYDMENRTLASVIPTNAYLKEGKNDWNSRTIRFQTPSLDSISDLGCDVLEEVLEHDVMKRTNRVFPNTDPVTGMKIYLHLPKEGCAVLASGGSIAKISNYETGVSYTNLSVSLTPESFENRPELQTSRIQPIEKCMKKVNWAPK